MSNNGNTYRMVSIIALVLGVVGVTLGYAAFSNTLTITSTAEVHPDENNFNVDFSSSSSSVVENDITGMICDNSTEGVYQMMKQVLLSPAILEKYRKNLKEHPITNDVALKQFKVACGL